MPESSKETMKSWPSISTSRLMGLLNFMETLPLICSDDALEPTARPLPRYRWEFYVRAAALRNRKLYRIGSRVAECRISKANERRDVGLSANQGDDSFPHGLLSVCKVGYFRVVGAQSRENVGGAA